MHRRAIFVPLLLVLAACAGHGGHHAGHVGAGVSEEGLVHWQRLAAGKEAAALHKKPMLVDFYVPEGCSRCERMNRDVWGNPDIARRVNEGFIPVRIDLTRNLTREEIALGKKYDYNYDCLLLFLDHRGEVLNDSVGGRMCFAEFVDANWFLGYLEKALATAAP